MYTIHTYMNEILPKKKRNKIELDHRVRVRVNGTSGSHTYTTRIHISVKFIASE